MLETEIKLRVPSAASARALLRGAGFQVHERRALEINLLFDQPGGTLRLAGRTLRVRWVNKRCVLTVKGQVIPGRHKSRPEYEVTVSDGEALVAMLGELGYENSYRYEKFRTEFRPAGKGGLAMLDETPMGVFLELEGTSPWIDQTARKLGFAEATYIRQSYVTLWAAHCREQGIEVGPMVFPKNPRVPR